jgi:hypothetical protein
LEATLLEPALSTLADDCEALGAYGTGLLASEIARHDTHGFAALVARRLESAP